MSDFKKGQIVYVSDNEKCWFISHFLNTNGVGFVASTNKIDAIKTGYGHYYKYCISIEDYEKMLSTPKDKQPVYAWDNEDKFMRQIRFYDAKNNCSFNHYSGGRDAKKFQNYEPIPEDKIPEWMIEAQKHLED